MKVFLETIASGIIGGVLGAGLVAITMAAVLGFGELITLMVLR